MKKIIFLTAVLVIAISAFATVDGDRGFQMLRVLTDPATAGQAGSGAVLSESGFNFLDNAAAPLMKNVRAVSFSQNMWLFDTSMSNVGYRKSSTNRSFGFAIRYLDYGKIEYRDDEGSMPLGEYHPMDMNIVFNLGYRIKSSHLVGINVKGLYEKIDDSSATGIAGDIGYVYLTPLAGLKAIASVKNFGFTSKMDLEDIKLPVTFEAGINKESNFSGNMISMEGRLIKDIDNDELRGALGAEYSYQGRFLLRSGYKLNHDLESLSFGFGVRMRRFEVNYAYNPIKEELDDVHYLGINVRLK